MLAEDANIGKMPTTEGVPTIRFGACSRSFATQIDISVACTLLKASLEVPGMLKNTFSDMVSIPVVETLLIGRRDFVGAKTALESVPPRLAMELMASAAEVDSLRFMVACCC